MKMAPISASKSGTPAPAAAPATSPAVKVEPEGAEDEVAGAVD